MNNVFITADKGVYFFMNKVFIIAEIGINHNGDLNIAKKLIDYAAKFGCDAVKFQKRDIDLVYSKEQLKSFRESPWGNTFRAQKEGLEFGLAEYEFIDEYCKQKGIEWFASAWDIKSQYFLQNFNLNYNKVASAMLTNIPLLIEIAKEKRHTFISTGMSTYDEIDKAVDIFKKYNCPFELMHCNSTYPCKINDINLRVMNVLRAKYRCRIGYSGHEKGRISSIAAVAMGANSIERHITLDRTAYGSDQSASLEIADFGRLIEDIRSVEVAMGNGFKELTIEELAVRKKMRGY